MGTSVDLDNEIVQSNRKDGNQTRAKYLEGMLQGFQAITSKCAVDAKLFMYYKDSKLSNIAVLFDLLSDLGWNFQTQIHVNKGDFNYQQNATKRGTVPGDCLLIFTLGGEKLVPSPKFITIDARDEAIIKLV